MNINEKTWDFVREHADEDVRKVALLGTKDAEVDLQMALVLIAGRQTARKKLPSWAAVEGIVYPPHLNMEQCSSEQTARYKAGLVLGDGCRVLGDGCRVLDDGCWVLDDGCRVLGDSLTFVDLTGGFGVDFYWMSQAIIHHPSPPTHHLIYVEQNEALCETARHNFALLGLDCSVCCCDAATYLARMPHADLIFMDPARRNEHGGRTYGIEDCTPNVLELMPQLLEKADRVMLKLSPMLDWRKAVDDIHHPSPITHHPSPITHHLSPITHHPSPTTHHLSPITHHPSPTPHHPSPFVHEVHIVSVDNECKELLIEVRKSEGEKVRIICVNLHSDGSEELFGFEYPSPSHLSPFNFQFSIFNFQFLYEPNASIMKAGCFVEVEEQFPVRQIAPNSHLFLSDVEIEEFPGRKFQILAISSMNKQELKRHFEEIINQKLTSMESANIAVRNFPMTVDQLRKKLKLKDGGDTYIFATTMASGEHKLLICRKIG